MRIKISSRPILSRAVSPHVASTAPFLILTAFFSPLLFLLGCYAPPLVPAPPNTGPETEALELFQGLFPPITSTTEAGPDSDPVAGLRLMDRLEHYGVPGVSIAVVDGGELRWAKAWGMAEGDLEDGRAMTPETLFQAGSISKLFTAAATIRHLESLDALDDASLLADEASLLGAEDLTLRRLLSHTAGLDTPGFEGYEKSDATPTLAQILAGEAPANHGAVSQRIPAGQAWRYSGGGYEVLERWLERSTGNDFSELVQGEILGPLEMASSSFDLPTTEENVAIGHGRDGQPLAEGWRVYPERAAAGLWTTAEDLAAWVIDMQKAQAGKPNRRLRRQEAVAMLTAQEPGGWGLGPQLGGKGHAAYFAHLGGNRGYRAAVIGFRASGHGAVILTNGENGMPLIREILAGIAKIYNWPYFRSQARDTVQITSEELAQVTGTFAIHSLPGLEIHLFSSSEESREGEEGDEGEDTGVKLQIEVFGETGHLLGGDEDRFFDLKHGFEVEVIERDAEGQAQKISLSSFPSYQFLAERAPSPTF